MKKYLLLIGIVFAGICTNAQSDRIQLSDSTNFEMATKLSAVESDILLECINKYNQLVKNKLDFDISSANTCDCIALKFGFDKVQQTELQQLAQGVIPHNGDITEAVLNHYFNQLVVSFTNKINTYRRGVTPNSSTNSETNQGLIPAVKNTPSQEFGILLGIIGVMSIGFFMLFYYNLKKIKELKKAGTSIIDIEAKAVLEQRLRNLEEGSSNLKSKLEKIESLESSVMVLKAELEAIVKKLGEVKSGSVKGGTTISAVVHSPELSSKTSVIYTQAPRNGLFIKILDQFIPRSTFYQIEINPQRNNTGEFTLVNDADTQQIAFNIPDTYLPNEACEIRNSGGPISTQRKWKILSKGQVERQNAAWKIIKPMIILFE